MTIGQFLVIVWIALAFAAIWQAVTSWLIFSVYFKVSFEKIYTFCKRVFFLIPIAIILIVAHLYFFVPSVRPAVDDFNNQFWIWADRVTFSMVNDDPTGRYTADYSRMPLYRENYDLVNADEVCADRFSPNDSFDDDTLNERCKDIPWTPKIRSTYLLLNEDGYFRYSKRQARALYNGQPIPPDPIYDN